MFCGSRVAFASRTILMTASRLSSPARSSRERSLTRAPKSRAPRVVGFATLGLGEMGLTSHGGAIEHAGQCCVPLSPWELNKYIMTDEGNDGLTLHTNRPSTAAGT